MPKPRKIVSCSIKPEVFEKLNTIQWATHWSPGSLAGEMLTILADCPPGSLRRILAVLEHAVRTIAPETIILDDPHRREVTLRQQRERELWDYKIAVYKKHLGEDEARRMKTAPAY